MVQSDIEIEYRYNSTIEILILEKSEKCDQCQTLVKPYFGPDATNDTIDFIIKRLTKILNEKPSGYNQCTGTWLSKNILLTWFWFSKPKYLENTMKKSLLNIMKRPGPASPRVLGGLWLYPKLKILTLAPPILKQLFLSGAKVAIFGRLRPIWSFQLVQVGIWSAIFFWSFTAFFGN